MSNSVEREINIGGTMETALNGQYQLHPSKVIKEAWQLTIRHFMSFSPAILILIALQLLIFYVALQLQIGDPMQLLDAILDPEKFDPSIFQAVFVANFSYEVVSAPFFAGVSLMAMSHAAGLSTKTRHLSKGLQYTLPIIIATLVSLTAQGIIGNFLPFISMYLSVAFSNYVLLICERKVPPLQSLWVSIRAVNKKLFPLILIYLLLMILFVIAAMAYGIGLILIVPMFFHAKGIIYREMFGIRIKIMTNVINEENDNSDTKPEIENYADKNTDGHVKPGSNTFDA
jgi:uncharacterized membrane protein